MQDRLREFAADAAAQAALTAAGFEVIAIGQGSPESSPRQTCLSTKNASRKTSWKEMYQVFNMGHRLEIYTDENSAQSIINISKSFNLDAKIIGRVEDFKENKLSISTNKGLFEY